ncbi:MAG: DUF2723 domain-containing protein [Caldilineaceae bacterium]|nr:DUF2723 domain-containing protein [Caldilineaceae bacterium]
MRTPVRFIVTRTALWVQLAAIGLPTGLSFWLYWATAAPGLTWAHFGADGGDLLVAAAVNGVPHPSGYPLYMLLLQDWLRLGHLISPQAEIAYWGNRLSALCVAGSVAFAIVTAASLLRPLPLRWLWAALAGVAWAVTPLAWSQALITEVYGLHALLIAALGWALLTRRLPAAGVGILLGLGAAHHLTSLLLWPAIFYWRLQALPRRAWLNEAASMAGVALLVALPLYLRLIWVVTAAAEVPPVAWGYPRDLTGLWWLVSGAAYRAYLFEMTPLQYAGRLAALVRLLIEQFTPVGLAIIIGGFALWDRHRPFLRNGALLWILPLSLYAAGYNTVDSYIYLLPVGWLAALMLAQGLASGSAFVRAWAATQRVRPAAWLVTSIVVMLPAVGLLSLIPFRLAQLDLHNDRAARDFVDAAAQILEPGSLVISSADAPTFALWYGQWGSGTLAQAVPDLVFVNHALYQFGWYRDLMHDLYPELYADAPTMGATIADLIAANRRLRPIYLTEPFPELPADILTPAGAFWRLGGP